MNIFDDPETVFEKVRLDSPQDVEKFSRSIIEAVYNRGLSSTQGKALSSMLASHRMIMLSVSFQERLAQVEEQLAIKAADGQPIGDRLQAAERASSVTSDLSPEDLETFEQRLEKFRARYGDYENEPESTQSEA